MLFSVECEQEEDAHFVYVYGELDVYTAPALLNQLIECVEQEANPLVLDLTDLTFCDARGLGVMVAIHKKTPYLRVVVPDDSSVRKTLNLCRLDRLLQLFVNEDEAVMAQ